MKRHYQSYVLFAFLFAFPVAEAVGQCTADAGPDRTICNGSSTVIGSPSAVNTAYLWSPTTGLSNPSQSNPTATPTVTTTYTVTATNSSAGCSAEDFVIVTVVDKPTANAGPDQAMCEGDTIIIGSPAEPGVTYYWAPFVRMSSNIVAQPKIYPTANITYTLTATNGFGCSAQDNIQIIVYPVPVANAGNDKNYCRGQSPVTIGFNAIPTFTYQWSPTTNLNDPTAAQPLASPFNTTAYTVIVTNSVTGCTASDQVVVYSYDVPTADAGPDKAICPGETTVIGTAPVATYNYAWSPTTNMSNPGSSSPTVGPTVTTTYTVIVTGSGGCQNNDDVIVYVGNPPVIDAGADRTICKGESTVIGSNNTPGVTYSWTPGVTLSDPNIGTPRASPTANTTYILTATNNVNGCSKKDSVIVSLYPVPPANAGRDTLFCLGGTASLGAPAVGGMSYNWSPATNLSSTSSSNPSANPASTTIYTVTVTNNSTNCTATDDVTVTVNQPPVAAAGFDRAICNGQTTKLGSPNVPGSNYSWNPGTNLSSTNIAEPDANPPATITYFVTVTNSATGCSASDDVIVTVNPKPTVSAGLDNTICAGKSVQIGNPAVAGYSYNWTPPTDLTSSTIANPTASPTITTIYVITITDNATGCAATDDVKITVNPQPVANAGLDRSICKGKNTQIGSNPVAGFIYSWNNGGTLSNTNTANPTATPIVTTIYTVSVTNASSSCSATDDVTVTVNPNPIADAGPDQITCSGVGVSIGSAAVANMSYSWSPPTALSATNNSNPIASPTANTIYTVVVTNTTTGCSANDAVSITVNPNPVANAGIDKAVCEGQTTAIGSAAVANMGYAWNPTAGLSNSSASNPNATPPSTTVYTVVVTNLSTGCTTSDDVTVTVNPLPTAVAGVDRAICKGQSTVLGTAPVAGFNYNWNPGTNLSSTAIANPTANPAANITYKVTITNGTSGCSASDDVVITVNPVPTANAGTDKVVCQNSPVSIGTAPVGGVTYSWSPTTGLNNPNVSNPTATPATAGTTNYILTVSFTATGCSSSDAMVLTVNPQPNANAGLDKSFCTNAGPVTIGTASVGTNSYAWLPTTGLNNPSIAMPAATAAATTIYTVTVLDNATGCTASDNMVLTVYSPPTATAGADFTFCSADKPIQIGSASSPNETYQWTPPQGLNAVTISNPKANPAITTSYVLTVNNTITGCNAKDTINITVKPSPSFNLGGNKNFCQNSTQQIGVNPNPNYNYQWTPTTNLSDPNIANPTATLAADVTYTLKVTDITNGCVKIDSVMYKVGPAPVYSAGRDTAICRGKSVRLGSKNPPANCSFSWSPAQTLDNSQVAIPIATPLVTTSYDLVVTDLIYGCIVTDQVIVTVIAPPIPMAGSDQAICIGQTAVLGTANDPNYLYKWTPAATLDKDDIAQPTASTTITTQYILQLTDNTYGCVAKDTVLLTVNPLPAFALTRNQSMCSNVPKAIGTASNAGYTYSWTPFIGLSDPSISDPLASPNTSTSYVLLVTDNATGCQKKDTVMLTVNPAPVIQPSPDVAYCQGDSATIGTAGPGSYVYSWSPTTALKNSNAATTIAKPTVTTTYDLVVSDASKTCSAWDTVVVTVNPIPVIEAGISNKYCKGTAIQLGVIGNQQYRCVWTPATGLNNATAAQPSLTVMSNATYVLTGTDSITGCVKTDTVIIRAIDYPVIQAGADRVICNGTSTILGSTNNIQYKYSWSPGKGMVDSTKATPTVNPTITTSYVLTVIDTSGICPTLDTVTVQVFNAIADAGTAQAICINNSAQIGSAPINGYTYNWTPTTDLNDPTISDPLASPTTTTTYLLTATDGQYGCSAMDSVIVTVNKILLSGAGNDTAICLGSSVTLGLKTNNNNYRYRWSPGMFLSNNRRPNPICFPQGNPPNTITYTLVITDITTGCFLLDTVVVTINRINNIFAGNNVTICAGGTVKLGSGLTNNTYQYTWSPGKTVNDSTLMTPDASPTITTKYVVIANDANGCSTQSSMMVDIIKTNVKFPAGYKICKNATVFLNPNPDVSYQYSWSPAADLISPATDPNPEANPTITTTYTVKAYKLSTQGDTCSTTSTIVVDVATQPLTLQITKDTTACKPNPLKLSAATTSSACKFYWYSDSLNSNPINPSTTDSIINVTPKIPTTYYIRVNNGYCEVIDSIKVKIDSVNISTIGCDICKGDVGLLRGINNSGKQLSYLWAPNTDLQGNVTNKSINANPTVTTTYTFTGTDSANCFAQVDAVVKIHDLPAIKATADRYSIQQGETVQLQAIPGNLQGYSYEWTPRQNVNTPDYSYSIAKPKRTTTYYITIKELAITQCAAADSIVINVIHENVCGEPDIFVANAFTPNDDGNNDYVYVRGSHIIKSFSLMIYSRWGQKVFETTNIDEGWDGTFQGESCNSDVYIYFLRGVCKDNTLFSKKGNITLLR